MNQMNLLRTRRSYPCTRLLGSYSFGFWRPRGNLKKRDAMCARVQGMTRAERTANMIGVVVPFLGLLAAIVLLWNQWVDTTDLAIMAVTYTLFGFGVTVGYH